jgi:rhodanese-related sulfurtransferase
MLHERKARSAVFKSCVKEALLVLAVSLAAAMVVNSLRPKGLDIFTPGNPNASGSPPTQSDREISLEAAIRRHADQSAIFADARSAADYEAGHIQGALSLPDQDMDAWIESFIAKTTPEALIIAYCEGVQCDLSKSLVDKLVDLGFVNARYVVDGWGRWKERQLPMEKGK